MYILYWVLKSSEYIKYFVSNFRHDCTHLSFQFAIDHHLSPKHHMIAFLHCIISEIHAYTRNKCFTQIYVHIYGFVNGICCQMVEQTSKSYLLTFSWTSKNVYNMEPTEGFLPNYLNVTQVCKVYKDKCRNINSEHLLLWLEFVIHASLEKNECNNIWTPFHSLL
jgi:hypothetical protein